MSFSTGQRCRRRTILKGFESVKEILSLTSITQEDILHARITLKQNADTLDEFFNTAVEEIAKLEEEKKGFQALEDTYLEEHASLEKNLCQLKARVDCELEKLSSSTTSGSSRSRQSILNTGFHACDSNSIAGIKVPDIVIPKFDGDLRKYHDWSTMFKNMVHETK